MTLRLESEIDSLRIAKIVDNLESDGLKLDFNSLKFLNDLVKKGIIGKDIDLFVKNNIMNKKGNL